MLHIIFINYMIFYKLLDVVTKRFKAGRILSNFEEIVYTLYIGDRVKMT